MTLCYFQSIRLHDADVLVTASCRPRVCHPSSILSIVLGYRSIPSRAFPGAAIAVALLPA